MHHNVKKHFACPCCDYLTIQDVRRHEICPVCYWEDDPIQFEDRAYMGGANEVSLQEAKINYRKYGASMKEYVRFVRQPKQEEFPSFLK